MVTGDVRMGPECITNCTHGIQYATALDLDMLLETLIQTDPLAQMTVMAEWPDSNHQRTPLSWAAGFGR